MTLISALLGTLVSLATSEVIRVLDTRGDYVRNKEPLDFVRTNSTSVPELNTATLKTDSKADLPNQFTICTSCFIANWYSGDGGRRGFTCIQVLNEKRVSWFWLSLQPTFYVSKDTEDVVFEVWFLHGHWTRGTSFLGNSGSVRFNRWSHMCLSLDLITENIFVVVDGIVVKDGKMEGIAQEKPSSLSGRVVLGKMADSNYWFQVGMLSTNTQIYGRTLTKEEMVSITSSEDCVMEGDYLAWREMAWDVKGPAITWTTVTKEELCSQSTLVRFIPEAETHQGALR